MPDTPAEAVRDEQAHVDRAYARLEELRARAERRRLDALARDVTTHADLLNRDAAAHQALNRLHELTLGDLEPLVFGRIDHESDEQHHIGRISVLSEEYEPLVVDWRSDVAAAFYRATAAEPLGLRRRRVIQCRGSKVLAVEDHLLDLDEEPSADELVGDAALMAAVLRERSEHMHDIVATIQREQDEIIRLPARGMVVVAGGPGTGKTAVALHRVAYLLYQHRERLAGRGVLVVGPSGAFTSYIERVLPSLGETRVALRPLGSFVPGVMTERHDALAVAAVKGGSEMATVAERLVDAAPRTPAAAIFQQLRHGELELGRVAAGLLDADEVELLRDAWRRDAETAEPPTVEDIPLIDELRRLTGEFGYVPASAPRAQEEVEELTTFGERSLTVDPGERIAASDYAEFGHIVVDEAQDLSFMQWRMVARRAAAATWTVVGDLAQRSSPAAPSKWSEISEIVRVRPLEVASLSVNYRTSKEIMAFAARLLPVIAPNQEPPHSVRETGLAPQVLTGVGDIVASAVAEAQAARAATTGTVAVVAPGDVHGKVISELGEEDVRVLDPWTVKGLEFDAVVVAEPDEIIEVAGLGALYVALTRATERLCVVSSAPGLPEPLSG